MTKLSFRPLPLPMFFAFAICLSFVGTTDAQVDDPFGVSPVTVTDDPFAAMASQPVGAVDDEVPESARRLIDDLQNELKGVHDVNLKLKEYIKKLEIEAGASKKQNAIKNEMHQKLFEQLLNSDDEKKQMAGLSHFMACLDRYPTQPNFIHPEGKIGGASELALSTSKPEVLRRLSLLTESKNSEIQLQAARVISIFHHGVAKELGFQFAPVWLPLGAAEIHRALNKEANVNHQESPLEEIVEDFSNAYSVRISFDKEVSKDQPITANMTGILWGETLGKLLGDYGLVYAVVDGQIHIMKSTDPRTVSEEVFNVRGLITDKLDIDGLAKLITENFPKPDVALTVIDENRIAIRATILNQRKVGKLLAKFAKPGKW